MYINVATEWTGILKKAVVVEFLRQFTFPRAAEILIQLYTAYFAENLF